MANRRPTGPRRVFIHVGSPKTGTTFLQNVLWRERALAAEQGVLLPLDRFHDHFLATLDVRGLADQPPHPPRAVGMWDRLLEVSADWPGNVLISHELFAGATAQQAERAVSRASAGAEVHIVLTVRDLVRQITAEWQEHVKHRSTRTLEDFVQDVRSDSDHDSWFWRVQDFAGVAHRWGAGLAPSHVHIVTVPPAGAPQGLLWDRFARLLGLDPDSFDTTAARSNTSLGLEQTELLRRVNVALGDRLTIPGPYPAIVKDVLAHRLLAARPGTPLLLRHADVQLAAEESRGIADRLRAQGVDVVGDLAEIVPDVDAVASVSGGYELPDPDVLLSESVATLADLLVEMSARRTAKDSGQRRFTDPVRVKAALVRASERHASLRKAREMYLRRRSRNDATVP